MEGRRKEKKAEIRERKPFIIKTHYSKIIVFFVKDSIAGEVSQTEVKKSAKLIKHDVNIYSVIKGGRRQQNKLQPEPSAAGFRGKK